MQIADLSRPTFDERELVHSSGSTSSQRDHSWLLLLGCASAIWALAYAGLGLFWTLGGSGFPFGAAHDPDPAIPKGLSILSGARQETGAPVILAAGLFAVLIAAVMASGRGKGLMASGVIVTAWLLAMLLAVIIPDSRPMIAAGHIPVLLAGKPFGWPDGVSISSQLPWPVLNQGLLILGGLLFGATALFYHRHIRGNCIACGRDASERAAHKGSGGIPGLGNLATWTAAGLPALYALTRWAYALGIPLGVSSEFLDEMERENPGIWLGGALLGCLAVGGSLLTMGLVQRWGEVFPRWLPALGGQSVPIPLAVAPAIIVSAIATSAGLMLVRIQLRDPSYGSWSLTGPGLLWPLWGVALFVAALAYYYRRRGPCKVCGMD